MPGMLELIQDFEYIAGRDGTGFCCLYGGDSGCIWSNLIKFEIVSFQFQRDKLFDERIQRPGYQRRQVDAGSMPTRDYSRSPETQIIANYVELVIMLSCAIKSFVINNILAINST